MCFSATASFTAAAALSIAGGVIMAKAPKKMWRLACLPIIFAAQQIFEGFVWLTLNQGDTTSFLHNFAVYGFLGIAGCFWPVWIPRALYLLEKNHVRKRILRWVMLAGVMTAVFFLLNYIFLGREAKIVDNHISYAVIRNTYGYLSESMVDYLEQVAFTLYTIVTIGAPLISTLNFAWIYSVLIGLGWILAWIYYYYTFGSVWCYFAAISSIVTYYVVVYANKTTKPLGKNSLKR